MTLDHYPADREMSISKPAKVDFGTKLFAALQELRERNNGKITTSQWIEAANRVFAESTTSRKKQPKSATRERNPLWDTLALECGIMDLNQITRISAKQIGVALADIQAVCPNLTTEEIKRRVQGYRRKYPSVACTPFAIASHWAEFGGGPRTERAKRDIYVEPEPGWREKAAARFPDAMGWGNPHNWATIEWKDVSTAIRPDILKEML